MVAGPTGSPRLVGEVLSAVTRLEADPAVDAASAAHFRVYAAGVTINHSRHSGDRKGSLLRALDWLTTAASCGSLPLDLRALAKTFAANAHATLAHCLPPADADDATKHASAHAHWAERSHNRAARILLSEVGEDDAVSDDLRSDAYAILARLLFSSHRWVEAHEAAASALDLDASNGLAALIAARTVGRAAAAGWDDQEHLWALHDLYVAQAALHVERFSYHQVALRELEQLKGIPAIGYALGDGMSAADPYAQWVHGQRLALRVSSEWLDGNNPKWDTAYPAALDSTEAKHRGTILMLNALKGDYLAARRLTFRAHSMFAGESEQASELDANDPGTYMAIPESMHGEQVGMAILAQRATLDVLDKVAVAVNEYLQIGDRPRDVTFRKFWTTRKDGLRDEFLDSQNNVSAYLALAELADDLARGLYVDEQDLRHVGTHRFAVISVSPWTSEKGATLEAYTLAEVSRLSIRALRVARAAYMHLVEIVQRGECDDVALPAKLALLNSPGFGEELTPAPAATS